MSRVLRFLAVLAACSTVASVGAAGDDEPLDPDKAFRPDARLVAGEPSSGKSERHGIDVLYRIEPGYYLYRDRLRFDMVPGTLLVGAPEFPPGAEIEDPFIGKQVVYRDRLAVHLPFTVSVVKPGRYKVRITAQGCAENRICYAPFVQEIVVNIPPGYRVADAPDAPTRPVPR